MNERLSLTYRLFVGVMICSLVAVLVYTDRTYRSQTSSGADPSPMLAQSSVTSNPSTPPSVSGAGKIADGRVSQRPDKPESDFFALRLLDAFKDAKVLDTDEQMEPEGILLKRDTLLTDNKYPLITREIRYQYDDGSQQWIPVSGSAWVADQVLIGLKEGQTLDALEPILQDFDAELVQNVRDNHHFLIRFHASKSDEMEDTLSSLRLYGAVAYAEPNFFKVPTYVPNDSNFYNLWALNNLGSGSGTFDADIDAVEAWDVTVGDPNVLVAVIDTGVQVDHPDLQGRIYYNLLERENGVDDDGNGFVDDIHGWNFYELNLGSNDVSDTSLSHGTHVAGIIAANGNNQVGVVGVSPGITLLPVKIFNDAGGYTSDLIRGMDYAANMGASIINVSLGGSDSSSAEKAMVENLQKRGILLVTSSGNTGADGDLKKSYPGCYPYNNIINVAASNWFDEMEDYSTWGAVSVDVCAPGTQILSTVAIDKYEYYSGTSMAAPHVAGVAALVKSVRTDWDASMLKEAILSTVDPLVTAMGKTVSGGRVNAGAAVEFARVNTFFPNGLHIRIKSLVNGAYVAPDEEGGSFQLLASSETGGKSQTFEVVQVDESTYAFRSLANLKYVTAEAGGSEPLSATRDAIGDWELFYPINLGEGHYAFRSKVNGLVVSAENGAVDPLIANRETVGQWETFEIETLHLLPVGKMVALQSAVSGLFVSPRGDGVLVPTETVAGLRNIFYVGLSMDGFITLKSFDSGGFVSGRTEGTIPLHATQTSVGDWEKFIAITGGNGHIALRCKANGKLVTTGQWGASPLVANQEDLTSEVLLNSHVIED